MKIVIEITSFYLLLVFVTVKSQEGCPIRPCFQQNSCPEGYAVDENGCQTCECISGPGGQGAPRCPGEDSRCFERINCLNGFIVTSAGCMVCACKSMCPSYSCLETMKCSRGFRKDSSGCDICQCLDSDPIKQCEEPDCLNTMTCQYGFQVDDKGCDICRCRTSPSRPCADLNCPHCRWGYAYDQDGCRTCECRNRPVPCPEPLCMDRCEHGYKYNRFNCMTCQCNEPPNPLACNGVMCSSAETCREVDNKLEAVYECVGNSHQPLCNGVNCPPGHRCVNYNNMNRAVCVALPACDGLLTCRIACSNGFETDTFGCEICSCRDTLGCTSCGGGTSCKRVGTKMTPVKQCVSSDYTNPCAVRLCASGPCMVLGGIGVCFNSPLANLCREPLCDMDCQYGFKTDINGCEICECKSPPTCTTDSSCNSGMVCIETDNKLTPNYQCVARNWQSQCNGIQCPFGLICRTIQGQGPVCVSVNRCGPQCTMFCSDGFVLDEHLCPKCECRQSSPCSNGCGSQKTCQIASYNLTPIRTCVGRNWRSFCELIRCPASSRCSMWNGRGTCTINACPNLSRTCNLECQFGYEKDERECEVCQCRTSQDCPLSCRPGQHCELRPVQCIRAPCPPVPRCVADTTRCTSIKSTCSLKCEPDGYMKDAKGCEICRCRQFNRQSQPPTCFPPCKTNEWCHTRTLSCKPINCAKCDINKFLRDVRDQNGSLMECQCLDFITFCKRARCTGTSRCLIQSSNCQGRYCLKNRAVCYDPENDP